MVFDSMNTEIRQVDGAEFCGALVDCRINRRLVGLEDLLAGFKYRNAGTQGM